MGAGFSPPFSFVGLVSIVTKTITLSHDYRAGAEDVWDIATRFDALDRVNRPRIVMTGLPTGRIFQGQKIDVMVSLFGKLPNQPYRMDVVICDDEKRHFRSSEHGAGVKSWEHDLNVVETEYGSRITESISIDAGFLTPLFAAWARYLYKARHPGRLELLSEKAASV